MDDVIPGRDGLENLRYLKKSQLKVDIGPWRQTVESLPLEHRELSSLLLRHVVGVLQIFTDRDLKTSQDAPHVRMGLA